MSRIIDVSDETFEKEVLNASVPVLVDFWADWCQPCKKMHATLEDIAESYQGKVKITKLNVDEQVETPEKFGIRGLPTLMLFKNGEVKETKVGAISKSQLAAFLDSQL